MLPACVGGEEGEDEVEALRHVVRAHLTLSLTLQNNDTDTCTCRCDVGKLLSQSLIIGIGFDVYNNTLGQIHTLISPP